MIQRRLKINDDTWTVKVVTVEQMIEACGDANCAGLTIMDAKTILILEEALDYRVICHEIFHAYFHYLHLSDTEDLPLDQIEEILANFIAASGDTLVRKAKRLTKDLLKAYEEKNG